MTHEPIDQSPYDDWLASRKAISPSTDLAERVMASLQDSHKESSDNPTLLRLVDRIEHSLPARLAACACGLMIGSVPFLFLAYVAQSPLF